MKTTRSILSAASLAVASGLLLVACSSSAPPGGEGEALVIDGETIATAELFDAARQEGTLILYSGLGEDAESQFDEAFTQDTGIPVELIRLAPNRLYERILSEQGAGRLTADVIRTSGEDLILGIAESGAFRTHDLPADFALVEGTSFQDGLYYRSFDTAYGFAYNSQLVEDSDAPQAWNDLLGSRWDGQLGIVQVGAGGSTAALTRFQLDALGEEFLRGYAAQQPRIFDSIGAQVDALARGEITAATIPYDVALGAIDDGAPLTAVIPDEGAAAFSYYLGATADGQHPAAAELFMNWSLSQRGQEVASALGDYAVRTDVSAPRVGDEELPDRESGFLHRYDADQILPYVEEDAGLWREIFGYTG